MKQLTKNIGIVASILAVVLMGACSTPAKIIKIGMINYTAAWAPTVANFKTQMEKLGYKEGTTIQYLWSGDLAKADEVLPALQKIKAEKPDLILSMSTFVTTTIMSDVKDKEIPIIIAGLYDPVGAGIVDSVKTPGHNVTGVWHGIADEPRWLAFRKIMPKATRLYVPFNPADKSAQSSLKRISELAKKDGVELVTKECKDATEQDACAKTIPEGIDAVYLTWDPAMGSRIKLIYAATRERKIPVIGLNETYAKDGALLAYGFSLASLGTQSANIAQKILKGAKAGEMPLETADFYVYYNKAVADAYGITIPEDMLLQATTIVRELPPQ